MNHLSVLLLLFAAFVGCSQEKVSLDYDPTLDSSAGPVPLPSVNEELDGPHLNDSGIYYYLALGDSYTKGESVERAKSFPFQLTTRLAQELKVEVNTEVLAQTGWTTSNLLDALKSGTSRTSYNLVTLLIGVNNQYQGKSFNIYTREFSQLLDSAIALAYGNPKNVVVISIPDYAYTPFAEGRDRSKISEEIDEYNAHAKSVALQKGVPFLNITDITRNGLSNPELVATDGLHPSAQAYTAFVGALYPMILPIFE